MQRADFLRALILKVSLWRSGRGGLLKALSALFGTVAVTMSSWTKVKNRDRFIWE